MRNFDYLQLQDYLWPEEITSLVTQIEMYRDRQQEYLQQKPEALEDLARRARIDSILASNAIEGIVTADERITVLAEGRTSPRTADEEAILGYQDVLDLINESYEYIPLNSSVILQLHRDMLRHTGAGHAGKFKSTQNQIVKTDQNGKKQVLFEPLPAFETPAAVEKICVEYNRALKQGISPLILIPVFINDFLNINPFNDGNGRMARLLTSLLLDQSGFTVGRYISLENRIETSQDLYYEALLAGNEVWNSYKVFYIDFIRYFLQLVLASFQAMEQQDTRSFR